MPRPPKSVRDALKASGDWDFQPSPPPFDPADAFASSVQLEAPNPGAFEAVADFSSPAPPTAYFADGPLFGDFANVAEDLLFAELPNPGVFQRMGWDGIEVARHVFSTAYAAAAVQVASAHDGMGFGTSRVSHLTGNSVYLPSLVAQYLETIGEFVGPDDRRWLLTDFPSTVDALARSCQQILNDGDLDQVKAKFWLPVRADDGRTAAFASVGLSNYLQDRGHMIPAAGLIGHVFSGTLPPAYAAIAQSLALEEREALGLVFKDYSSDRQFLSRFTSSQGYRALGLLGLEWDSPSLHDLGNFGSSVTIVTERLMSWMVTWQSVQKGLSVPFRKVSFRRQGDPWQMCTIVERPGGVEVSSFYTLQKRGANYRACVGTPMVYHSAPMRMKAVGRLDVPALRVSLIRDTFGINV